MILTFYDLTSHDNGIMEKINREKVHDEGISIEEFALPRTSCSSSMSSLRGLRVTSILSSFMEDVLFTCVIHTKQV